MKIGDVVVHVGGSVGWTLAGAGEADAEAILVRADHAMYRQKQSRRSV